MTRATKLTLTGRLYQGESRNMSASADEGIDTQGPGGAPRTVAGSLRLENKIMVVSTLNMNSEHIQNGFHSLTFFFVQS